MDDIYYTPEKFGLTTVGEIEWALVAYEFDLTAVWKDEYTRYYLADDTGCSCPTPFERFTSLDTLDGPFTSFEAATALQERLTERKGEDKDRTYPYMSDTAEAQVLDVIARIMTGKTE